MVGNKCRASTVHSYIYTSQSHRCPVTKVNLSFFSNLSSNYSSFMSQILLSIFLLLFCFSPVLQACCKQHAVSNINSRNKGSYSQAKDPAEGHGCCIVRTTKRLVSYHLQPCIRRIFKTLKCLATGRHISMKYQLLTVDA